MELLSASEIMLIAASPSLGGSLIRIPYGFNVGTTGGKKVG